MYSIMTFVVLIITYYGIVNDMIMTHSNISYMTHCD